MDSKKCIDISLNVEKPELFDQHLPLKTVEDFWELLLCHGGSLVEEVTVGMDINGRTPPTEQRLYPRSLIKTLLLVGAFSLIFFQKKMPLHFQNAWQTKFPEEFVEHIFFVIPPGADVDNPIEDAALMAKVGAKRINYIEFELENAVTGTPFRFNWNQSSGDHPSYWRLNKDEEYC